MNKLKLGSCYLLSYLFAVVQVTGSAVSFHQRCFKSQILKKTKKNKTFQLQIKLHTLVIMIFIQKYVKNVTNSLAKK